MEVIDLAGAFIITFIGILLLCFGGYSLVSGGVAIAKKFRISSLLIGLTVVAYGTSTPELAASVTSAIIGDTDLILGNVVGSNIANIGMVIGISAIAALLISRHQMSKKNKLWLGVGMDKKTLSIWIPIMLGVSVLLIAATIVDNNNISRETGYIFIAILVGLTFYTIHRAKNIRQSIKEKDLKDKLTEDVLDQSKYEDEHSVGYFLRKVEKQNPITQIIFGAAALCVGGIMTIYGSIDIAGSLGVSTTIVGIVIVAIGTSLPELVTSIIAIKKGEANIGIGNIIGSNIYNILLILGVSAIIAGKMSTASLFGPEQLQNLIPNDFLVMIFFSGIILIFFKKGVIPWWFGAILLILYTIYLIRTSIGVA
jgi:cation:H+ antiporter